MESKIIASDHLVISEIQKEKCCSKTKDDTNADKTCRKCNKTLANTNTNFRDNRRVCRDCEKQHGREYRQSEKGKEKANSWVEKNREKMTELQANWFQENKSYVQAKNRERTATDERYKFMNNQRRRISLALGNKQKKTIEYLGCNSEEFHDWISSHNIGNSNQDNNTVKMHIDHVIPLSTFNLENESEVLLAFNWRNTMPLSATENLKKNNKIVKSQVEQHLKKLEDYHREKQIELPQIFIDLFAM